MTLGFNTDVRLEDTVYHVQTEDRGAAHPYIDTLVYAQGRVVHRRTSSYGDLLESPGASEAILERRVEEQHRSVIEELRAGTLPLSGPAAPPAAPRGIQVELRNPASWVASGIATLLIEVRDRGTRRPTPGADIEVELGGPRGPIRFSARTDARGAVEVSFPLPELGPGGAMLVVRAASVAGQDEIRYQLRPRPRAPAAQAPAK